MLVSMAPPIPADEKERLAALHNLHILDTLPEERFDRITKLATSIFCVPISTVTLVDSNREWFKSCQGLPQHEGERAISFCGYAILEDDILIIPDTTKDPRFEFNPMVIGEPFIKFYADVFILNNLKAFCVVIKAISSIVTDNISANLSATNFKCDGSFRLPRNGTGLRYGASVSKTK